MTGKATRGDAFEPAKGIAGRVPFFQLGLPISGVAPLAPSIKAEFRGLTNQSTLISLIYRQIKTKRPLLIRLAQWRLALALRSFCKACDERRKKLRVSHKQLLGS